MTSGENTRAATYGNSSKLQGDLNFAFDQRESEVNLHKATSSPESPSNVSPELRGEHQKLSTTLKMFKNLNVLFCRRRQNNFWYSKYNDRTGLKINRFSKHFLLSGIVDQATIYCLPLHYNVLVAHRFVFLVSKFSIKHLNCLIAFI